MPPQVLDHFGDTVDEPAGPALGKLRLTHRLGELQPVGCALPEDPDNLDAGHRRHVEDGRVICDFEKCHGRGIVG